MSATQFVHGVLPTASHDERAREAFVASFRQSVVKHLVPGVVDVWETRVKGQLGGEPESRAQIRRAMLAEPYVQMTYSLRRIIQEQVWDTTAGIVGRQIDELNERARSTPASSGGTLELDPELEIPRYLKAVDIHAMPTGYWDEVTDGYDVGAGAIYDRGVYLYALGQSGPLNDGRGRSIVHNFFRAKLPDFRPARMLDMGVSFGGALLPYCDAFPDAEIYGIDVGPGILRYAHARAESLGKTVHLSQQNAERTRFADGYFDLVTSHILLHETSRSAMRNIFAECHRLLAPGGLMVHAEVPQYDGVDLFTEFMIDYDTHYNNEPFWGAMHDTDLHALAVDVGFASADVWTELVPSGRSETTDRTGKASASKAAGMLQLTVARKAAGP
jgi:ubiquinone/menaquinone biosynthesis C-methylase UbiE